MMAFTLFCYLFYSKKPQGFALSQVHLDNTQPLGSAPKSQFGDGHDCTDTQAVNWLHNLPQNF
jgi:hypothetical protein